MAIVVLRPMCLVMAPPAASMPMDKGGATTRSGKSSALCGSLIRVDGAVGLRAVEELLDHGLHLGNARGATNQSSLMRACRHISTGPIESRKYFMLNSSVRARERKQE